MIKRNGTEIMNARTKNVSIAKETLEIIKNKHYTAPSGKIIDIAQSQDFAVQNTEIYKDTDLEVKTIFRLVKLEVTTETTAQAAVRFLSQNKTDVAALNFASARSPGGGFLGGAQAQEEDLCRCSSLYACLKNKPMFYNENLLLDDTYYTNNMMYSPKVPFFRNEHNLLLEEPFEVSIITAPAPNVSSINREEVYDTLNEIFVERTAKILKIAHRHQHRNLVLGAWGCGAFGNDPIVVAKAFVSALQQVPVFDNVCFAVYDTKPNQPLFNTFKQLIK